MWLTEVPQPRPPRETWADDPVFAALDAAYSEHQVENPEFTGIHYMDAGTVEAAVRKALATLAPAQQTATRRVLTRLVHSLDAEAAPPGRRTSRVPPRATRRRTKGRSSL